MGFLTVFGGGWGGFDCLAWPLGSTWETEMWASFKPWVLPHFRKKSPRSSGTSYQPPSCLAVSDLNMAQLSSQINAPRGVGGPNILGGWGSEVTPTAYQTEHGVLQFTLVRVHCFDVLHDCSFLRPEPSFLIPSLHSWDRTHSQMLFLTHEVDFCNRELLVLKSDF